LPCDSVGKRGPRRKSHELPGGSIIKKNETGKKEKAFVNLLIREARDLLPGEEGQTYGVRLLDSQPSEERGKIQSCAVRIFGLLREEKKKRAVCSGSCKQKKLKCEEMEGGGTHYIHHLLGEKYTSDILPEGKERARAGLSYRRRGS